MKVMNPTASSYTAIGAIFIAYALTGSVVASVGSKLATTIENSDIILPLISQVVMEIVSTGLLLPLTIAAGGIISVILAVLSKSDERRGQFITLLTTSWLLLLAGTLLTLLGFTLPFVYLLQSI
ncbi:hypothetical protein NT6N_06180 [Oceaniferula spumae]|uniref:Uncharacterized protein n=1 Tax=Oceaniferula spumae TaxID=2979115 RepID=A0AAT9FI05_9BACT